VALTVSTTPAWCGWLGYSSSGCRRQRHWNHRDAHRTRVTEDSTRVTFVLETLHAARDGDLLKVATEELQGLLIPHAGQTAVHYLSPARPQVTTGT
jgi:DNA/RNA-binding domain of Phe-tRNA-synthetase-like protein